MNKTKTKLLMSLSVIIIGFLTSSSSLNTISTQALIDTNENQYNIDSFDNSAWKWSTTEVVSTESVSASYDPSTAVDNLGDIHITWFDNTNYAGAGTDYDIFYKRWVSSTSSWTTTEVVSTESTTGSLRPSIATDVAGNIHIAWEDLTNYAGAGTDYDIFYKHWNSSTYAWTTTEVVSTESTGDSHYVSIVVDNLGDIHIAWEDRTDYEGAGGEYDVFYKRWDDSSSLWTTTEVVSTESTGDSNYASIAVYNLGDIHIAWEDATDYAGSGSGWDIFYKRWDSSSSSWTTTEVVSTESNSIAVYPSLAVDTDGVVHIAWEDHSDYTGAGLDEDIFYKRKESSAYSWIWTTTEVVSTVSVTSSYYASLTVDTSGNVHVAWFDYTDYAGSGTDIDIFYKLLTSPPATPELAFIVPNPTDIDTIHLDWNNVLGVTSYYVYRSPSYIWSIENLVPITTVSFSNYIDTVPSEGFYYYVVVAENYVSNSSHSNCQYVEVKFPDLEAPELAPILPNPTEITSISLVWDSVDGATEYYVYRSSVYIWSVEGLTPINTVGSTSYIDTLPSEGIYFYVIVASDGLRNSTHSNCEYTEYKLPTLYEFIIISSLIIGLPVFLFFVTRIRKKNTKQS